jgi:hypothetical protein
VVKAPAYSLGAIHEEEPGGKESKLRPGPGAYASDYKVTRSKSPNWRFGTDMRPDNAIKASKHVPGPGTYMNKEFIGNEGSHFSMAAHLQLDLPIIRIKPGPGDYEPNFLTQKKREGQPRFGSEERKDLQLE